MALDMKYVGEGKEVRDMILSAVGTACVMPTTTRPHLFVLPYGSAIVGELGDYLNEYMMNASVYQAGLTGGTAMSLAQQKIGDGASPPQTNLPQGATSDGLLC